MSSIKIPLTLTRSTNLGREDNSKIIKNRQFGVQQHRNIFQIAAFQHLSFNMQLSFQSSNMSSEIVIQSDLNNQNQY